MPSAGTNRDENSRNGPGHIDGQAEVIAFLLDPRNWHSPIDRIAHLETHGAHVFLGADHALKIKRAVRYDYMDFSTLAQRRTVIEKEFDLNRRFAPDLYISTVPITREENGRLAMGGKGTPVEFALRMRRFPDHALLSDTARQGALTPEIVKALALKVYASHQIATPDQSRNIAADIARTLASVATALKLSADPRVSARSNDWAGQARQAIDRNAAQLALRSSRGFVRRCHGDLHLGNIVMIDGQPMLFDALEFDDTLATVDILYDFAFLLMDLDVRGYRAEANLLLNQYLWQSGELADLDGLSLMPLYLAMRAGIRAMVGLQRHATTSGDNDSNCEPAPVRYLDYALAALAPPAPRLIAVGGLSGTGKSTTAAALAPEFGAAPGALHLRSDLERKRIAGVGETTRLPQDAYTREASAEVYRRLMARAAAALAAGHTVIVDAVFQGADERKAIENVALATGVPFTGIWLVASESDMISRIRNRRGDASDATEEVARRQLATTAGAITWHEVSTTSGLPEATIHQCRTVLQRRNDDRHR